MLGLYLVRTHQRLSEQTHIKFKTALAGQLIACEALLDGRRFESSNRVSIGRHSLEIRHPKATVFSTNLFVWYGEHDVGRIDLKRATGVLTVTADPAAVLLSIEGPEFKTTLTNSPGFTNSVPTDQYTIGAEYRHWKKTFATTVLANTDNRLQIAPRFGALQLTCNQSNATFQLLRTENELVSTGDFPSTITELPEGPYQLVALHHKHRWIERPQVKPGITNPVAIEFQYATARVQSTPAGASVTSLDGREWGVTPLTLPELQPGHWDFNLRLFNYEPATISLELVANETNTVYTNLISESYTSTVRAARQFLDAGDYNRAVESLNDALRVQPNDPTATAMRAQALGRASIGSAEALGEMGDYLSGIRELERALVALPGDARASSLLAEFKKREPEQREQMRLLRLHRGEQFFDKLVERHQDAKLFERREVKTTNLVEDVHTALLKGFRNQPAFQIKQDSAPGAAAPETFAVVTEQQFNTALATSAGFRRCVIVGARIKDDETQILFTVQEYKAEAVEKFSIGALIGAPTNVKTVAIHPSRVGPLSEKLQERVNEGVSNVTAIVRGAIGWTLPEK